MSVAVAFCALIRFVLNRMQLLPIEWFQLHLAIGEAALGVAVLLIHIALRIQALIVASWADAAASASASASASATATFESLMTALTVTRFLLVLSFHVDALFPTCISTFHAFVSTHQILSLRVAPVFEKRGIRNLIILAWVVSIGAMILVISIRSVDDTQPSVEGVVAISIGCPAIFLLATAIALFIVRSYQTKKRGKMLFKQSTIPSSYRH